MFQIGQQIGPYTLLKPIGKGGFGEVWLAEKRSQLVNKRVAVKLPLREQINFEAIQQEATLWEKASGHPNVLPLIDADIYDGQAIIVSEYAENGSLADKLKHGKAPLEIAVEKTIGILNGLEFLHSRQIIHRDIKPQNILLQGNTPRLADFGISRAMNTDTISSVVAGTDAYMSPQAFDGKRDEQTDIWSVGVVLYQMLKGNLPYPQQHPTERMFAILTKEFEPLGEEVPSEIKNIVEKALAKQPVDRFQTAAEMRDALKRSLAILQNRQISEDYSELKTEVAPLIQTDERTELKTERQTIAKNTGSANQPTAIFTPEQKSVVTEVQPNHLTENKKSKTKFLVGGLVLALLLGIGFFGLGGGTYYYYYVYLPQFEKENLVGVRPSVEYKVGDIARENIAPHANISFTNSQGNQITLKRGEIIVKKDELITPEIFEKVSAIYNYNDLSQ